MNGHKILSLCGALVLAAVSVMATEPIPVIVETDMGNDIDDALALDLLYKAMDDGRVSILGIGHHKKTATASDYIGILNTWYGYPDIPVGRSDTPVATDGSVDYTAAVVSMTKTDGSALFPATTRKEEPTVSMYRRLLSQQPDTSVVFVSLGFATELAKLLKSKADEWSPLSGRELVARKVRLLSIMAGSYGDNKIAEFNVKSDIASMRTLFDEWPVEVVQNPFEIGPEVLFPASVVTDSLAWAPAHPVAEGYKVYASMPYDRPTWDLLSVVYLLQPDMFDVSAPGRVSVNSDGYTSFMPGDGGMHRVLSATAEQCDKLRDYIIRQVSRVPLLRMIQ